MNLDAALEAIADIEGTELDLAERQPISLDFPISEYRRRWSRLAALMDVEGLDAVVFTQEEPIRYFSGYNSVVWAVGRWLPTVLVVTPNPARALLVGSSFDAGCAEGTTWTPTISYGWQNELPDLVGEHLRSIGAVGERVGFELGTGSTMALPQSLALRLLALGGTAPRDAASLFHVVRMLKSPAEIQRLRTSVRAAVAGYQAGLEVAKEGMTEKELVSVITSTMYRSGATAGTRPAFINCVSGRDRYPLVDTPASDRSFESGDIVFVDGGGACDGYVSDILRLIGVGAIRPEDRRYAEIASDATRVMVAAARAGITVSELRSTAVRSVLAAGSEDEVGVVAGHGIGLELWERPLIKVHDDPDENVVLRPGMVLCLEPILAPPAPGGGLAGVFVFEQQVVVGEGACEVLSGELADRLWEAG